MNPCPKCAEDERRADESVRQRIATVVRHCCNTVPDRCSRRSVRLTDLADVYYTLYPDGHYFDDDTMRYFDCRIGLHERTERGYLFVTSEQFHGSTSDDPRMWTVRILPMDYESVRAGAHVKDVSEFQEYSSRGGANSRLRREAKQ